MENKVFLGIQSKVLIVSGVFLILIGLNNCNQVLGDWIQPYWSPDGMYISMIEQIPYSAGVDTHYGNALYIVNTDGSNKRRLVEDIDINYIWSPKGDKILFSYPFASKKEALVVIDIISGEELILDKIHADDFSWSPDAERIAFIGENGQLFIVNVDGKNKKKLVDLGDICCSKVSWSPDGEKICFVTSKNDIFIIDPDGTNRKKLSTGFFMGWSPNSQQIAFFYAEYGVEKREAYLININNEKKEKITDYFAGEGFSWSPDGTKIAFFTNKEESSDPDGLFIMDLNSGNKEKLIDGCSRTFSWSPDGYNIVYDRKKISMDSFSDAYQLGVYLINIYTKDVIKFTPGGSIGGAVHLNFSPDGKKVLFQAFGRTMKTSADSSIYIIDSDGTNLKNLN